MGIEPGDVVCVMAGHYPSLRFRGLAGDTGAPIVIRNCGGLVEVGDPELDHAIVFEDGAHDFHLTGTGDASIEHGFRATAPDFEPAPGSALRVVGGCTRYEIDHVEIAETGLWGARIGAPPLCDRTHVPESFLASDVHLHDLFVHDTHGDALVVGDSLANGPGSACPGYVDADGYAFTGLRIERVRVERARGDGVVVGRATTACTVSDSEISDVQLTGGPGQGGAACGIALGAASRCDVRRNIVRDAGELGICADQIGSTTIADNLVVSGSIHVRASTATTGEVFRLAHNTVAGGGIAIEDVGAHDAALWNNLLIDGALSANGASEEGNLVYPDADAAGVTDAYALRATSPARGAGVSRHAEGFSTDLVGNPRAVPPSVGALEYVSGGGSGCAAGGTPTHSALQAMTGALVALVLARRIQRARR